MVKGLLGYGSSRSNESEVIPDVDRHNDIVSILPTDRSERIKTIDNWKEKRKKNNDFSCADSVLSDVTFSTKGPKAVRTEISHHASDRSSNSHTHDFILECDNGERIYVPSVQGKIIKSRCRSLLLSLERNRRNTNNVFWAGSESDSSSISTKESEERILTKNTWSPRATRHIVELLAEGSTWIDSDRNRFVELLRACDEINVRLHLGSPINYHDVLDPASSLRYFKLNDENIYRFQLVGALQSGQWMHLIQKGILLHLDSKVLMLSATDSTAERSNESEARQKRLTRCDELYSEFRVYSQRSKINTLYSILGILSATGNETKSRLEKKLHSRNRSATATTKQQESEEQSIQIVCKIVSGGLSERDWNTLWRMTSSSYRFSSPEEQSLLFHSQAEHGRKNLPCKEPTIDDSVRTVSTTDLTETVGRDSVDDSFLTDDTSQDSSTICPPPQEPDHPVQHKTETKIESESEVKIKAEVKTETRTITGKSLVALKHMFDAVNQCSSDRPSSAEQRDRSLFPACLSISNPTPDTLGRFLNACVDAVKPSKTSSASTVIQIGYEILSCSSSATGKHGIMFFVSNTNERIHEIVDSMADYSGTSVVGEADFRFEQRRHSAIRRASSHSTNR